MINPLHTLYAIHLKIDHPMAITVGKLGHFHLNEGIYIYVGSAKKNIQARINRHLQLEKTNRWHFDYIRPFGYITKIITYEQSIGECSLAEKLRKQVSGVYPIKGFGSSDCRCFSHLIYYNT